MTNTLKKIIGGKHDNHVLPFLWVHGEDEATYREMVNAIYNANIRAFCVEARPHEGFCKDEWWHDMDVILDEAEKLSMKVWILDDKHFPTGYANGGALNAPNCLRRQSVTGREIDAPKGETLSIDVTKYFCPEPPQGQLAMVLNMLEQRSGNKSIVFDDDRLLSVTVYENGKITDITSLVKDNVLTYTAKSDNEKIEICALTRNAGSHRSYINMMDYDSCTIQLNEVYEPHYAHYKDKFGTTIAGFFSDEPELGNGMLYACGNLLGTNQDLPWSRELETEIEKRLGKDYKKLLPLLWKNDFDKDETARVRYIYMDIVTRLVEKDFSKQIGDWCRAHGVMYIGHVIEDNNQHARTGSSLGHFFRGLKWQDMAGIDDIGGQVQPFGEDLISPNIFGGDKDGEFFHYALGKLGSSLGALNPNMKGRTMCEIFGNYLWEEGGQLEKYLIDHFMVKGVNYYVPHAFTCKAFPDPDCPPHFYAHGHNPLYRHFGEIMNYTNRVCTLISDGKIETPVAVMYHGESEWSGKCMLMQKVSRILTDNQIDFDFMPSDAFSERDFYKTEISDVLTVNGRVHKLLVVPYAEYITKAFADGATELMSKGGKVVFIDALPSGLCEGGSIPENLKSCKIVALDKLIDYLTEENIASYSISPKSDRIRSMHYTADTEIYYFINEGTDTYKGNIYLPINEAFEYSAWDNKLYELSYTKRNGGIEIDAVIEPRKSLIIVVGKTDSKLERKVFAEGDKTELDSFTVSTCDAINYPNFTKAKTNTLGNYNLTEKNFAGFVRYDTKVNLKDASSVALEITEAYDSTEVFVNGKSVGIQVVPSFLFDITDYVSAGENDIAIEVASTLDAAVPIDEMHKAMMGITGERQFYSGITGKVILWTK